MHKLLNLASLLLLFTCLPFANTVDKMKVRLKLSESFVAVSTESFEPIVCELDPPVTHAKLPHFITIRGYHNAVIRFNRIIPGFGGTNNQNGSYVCVFDGFGRFLTKVLVIATVGKFHI